MSWNELLQHPQERPVFFHRESFWQMDFLLGGDVLLELVFQWLLHHAIVVKPPYFGRNSYLWNNNHKGAIGCLFGWISWLPFISIPAIWRFFQQRFSLFDIRFFAKLARNTTSSAESMSWTSKTRFQRSNISNNGVCLKKCTNYVPRFLGYTELTADTRNDQAKSGAHRQVLRGNFSMGIFLALRSLDPPMEGFWTCIARVRVLKIAIFDGSGFLGGMNVWLFVLWFDAMLWKLWSWWWIKKDKRQWHSWFMLFKWVETTN